MLMCVVLVNVDIAAAAVVGAFVTTDASVEALDTVGLLMGSD